MRAADMKSVNIGEAEGVSIRGNAACIVGIDLGLRNRMSCQQGQQQWALVLAHNR